MIPQRDTLVPVRRVGIILAGYLVVAGLALLSPGRVRPPDAVPSDSARRGLELWRAQNCTSCHALFGLGGHIGPDLTNTIPVHGPRHLRLSLQNGHIGMPAFDLNPDEIDAVASYLEHVSRFGVYPLRKRPLPPFGAMP